MSKITPPELERRLEGDDRVSVLDVRPRETYQQSHIDGSRNVPVYHALRKGDDGELRGSLSRIPEDATVVTVCKAGIVARTATDVLEEEGYDAVTLAGGMRRWTGYRNGSLGYRLGAAVRRLLP